MISVVQTGLAEQSGSVTAAVQRRLTPPEKAREGGGWPAERADVDTDYDYEHEHEQE